MRGMRVESVRRPICGFFIHSLCGRGDRSRTNLVMSLSSPSYCGIFMRVSQRICEIAPAFQIILTVSELLRDVPLPRERARVVLCVQPL